MEDGVNGVRIAGTGSAVQGHARRTSDLVAEAFPDADETTRRQIVDRTGIETRYWLEPGQTAAALAAEAVRRALDRAALPAKQLRRIILCTSTGGDYLVPATANSVAGLLGLDETCDAFDVSNSCVGFLSGLDLAARSVATDLGPVAVVAVETFSRLLSPRGPRAYVVLGDAAAAAVIDRAPSGGVLASHLRISSRLRGRMTMAQPGTPDARPYHDFDARSRELAETAKACFQRGIDAVLSVAGLGLPDVDWVLFHQPNAELYRILLDSFHVDPARVVPIIADVGSIGAASVPTSLDRLMRTRDVRPGQHILMASVGAGTAYGAILYQVPG